jgi:hypothetical protein
MTTLAFLVSSGLLLSAVCASAQQYVIPWFAVGSGGGNSAGGGFSLTGTLGQHDLGQMRGGDFALAGGYWGTTSIELPAEPSISVSVVGNSILLSWPVSVSGWVLETTTAIANSPVWMEVPAPYQVKGASILFSEPLPKGSKFYRLRKL